MSNIGPVPSGEIALYEAPDIQVRLDVRPERETIWLKKVYAEGELGAEATTEDYSVVRSGGRTAGSSATRARVGGDRRDRRARPTGCGSGRRQDAPLRDFRGAKE